MGVCIPENNKQQPITSIYDKASLGKSNISQSHYSTNFTNSRTLKSLKSVSNQELRISKLTKYDDITKYYTLSKNKISEGGSGIVFGGNKINNKNDKNYEFAIKKVSKKDNISNIALSKEIEINSIIHHNNIVKCFDIFEDDLDVYFVFEMMPDGDLFDYIIKKPEHHLKEKEVIIILEQIFLSLIYLHEKLKITHRDIKPENFMLKINKNHLTIKLMDFGTSDFNQKNGFTTITQGTPNYIAPEIYLEEPYNSKVDMWATGVVLYNMIAGTHPFQMKGGNMSISRVDQSIISEIEDQKIIDDVLHKEINFSVFDNTNLKMLAMHLLERDPDKRFSALQAYDELKKIKKNQSNIFNTAVKQKIDKSSMIFQSVNNIIEKNKKDNRLGSVKSKLGNNIKNLFKGDDDDKREDLKTNVINITINKKVLA